MSDLIAIAYPDQATAERVRGRLAEAIKAKLIEIDDAVVVTRDDDGKVKLHQAASPRRRRSGGGRGLGWPDRPDLPRALARYGRRRRRRSRWRSDGRLRRRRRLHEGAG